MSLSTSHARRGGVRGARRRAPLALETLEDRLAPATSPLASALPAGPGVFDSATATWYLRSTPTAGAPDAGQFVFGAPGWFPVVGDWTGAGHAGLGVVDLATHNWYLRNEISQGPPDAGQFQYGFAAALPVA